MHRDLFLLLVRLGALQFSDFSDLISSILHIAIAAAGRIHIDGAGSLHDMKASRRAGAWIYSNGTGSRAACRPQCLTMSGRWLKQLQQKKENNARMNRNTSWYSLMKCVCVCAPQDLAKIAFEARKRHHESESSRLIRMVN